MPQADASPESEDTALRAAHERVFGEIWQRNGWGNVESRSGPGSATRRTEPFRKAFAAFIEQAKPHMLYDAPCGDFHWMKLVDLPASTRYVGADIVAEMIETLQREHGGARRQFLVRDIVVDPAPDADVWLCRESLFHLPLAAIGRVLENWRASNISYFLATTTPSVDANLDIPVGHWRPLNMEIEPFGLGPAMAYLPDAAPADPAKVVGVWRKSN